MRAKVLVIVGQLEIGGAEIHLSQVLPKIDRSRFEIIVFCFRRGGSLFADIEGQGITIITPQHNARGLIGVALTGWKLIGTLRRLKPRIIHYFLPEAYLLGGICSLLSSSKKLMSRRSLNHYQARRWYARPIERFLHRRMNAVLANSNAIKLQLLEEDISEQKLSVIYNGVDAERFTVSHEEKLSARKKMGLGVDYCGIIVVANLIPYKGHRDLLKALSSVHLRGVNNWKLFVVGADSSQIMAELTRLGESLEIGEKIIWAGRQDTPQKFLAAADIGVSASHEEGFSNAVLEYMASGLAVLATNVGGTPEALPDGQGGILVNPRDHKAMAIELESLLTNADKRKRLGEAALSRVSQVFTIEKCVEQYNATYEKLAH